MARNSKEWMVVIWSREDPLFPAHQDEVNPPSNIYKCGIMLLLKERYFY